MDGARPLLDGWLKSTLVHRHAFIPSLSRTRAIGFEARVPGSFAEARDPLGRAVDAVRGPAFEAALRRGGWAAAVRLLRLEGEDAAALALRGLFLMHGASSKPGFEGMLDRYANARGLRDLESAAAGGGFWPAFVWLGLARLRRCELSGAREAFDRLVRLRPEWAWSWILRSECARVDIELDESAADLDRAIRLEPDNPWALALRSRVRFQRRPELSALADLDRAVRLEPRAGWLRAWRGDARRKLGDLRGALGDLEAARALEPSYDRTYLWLGKTLGALGETAQALEALEEGPRRCPHFEKAFSERSRLLARLGRFGEAFRELGRAVRLNHRHNWLGSWTVEPAPIEGDRRLAMDAIEAAARKLPGSNWALAWRGESRTQAGDPASGLADLDAALRRSPRMAWARAWRGEALLRLGRLAESRRELDRAVSLDPSYGRAYAWRGRLRHLGGDFAGAMEDLDRSVGDGLVEYSWLYLWRAEVHRALGREERARADRRTANFLEPGLAEAGR